MMKSHSNPGTVKLKRYDNHHIPREETYGGRYAHCQNFFFGQIFNLLYKPSICISILSNFWLIIAYTKMLNLRIARKLSNNIVLSEDT